MFIKIHLYATILLFTCAAISSCATRKAVGSVVDRTNSLHRQMARVDKRLKANFPGSEVQEYLDNSGKPTILAIVNVFESPRRSSPLNSRDLDNLPTIWINRDSILDRLSSEIAEYLLNRAGLPPAAHIVVRLDKDRFSNSYISFYQVAQDQQYWNGIGPFLNFERGQYMSYNFLQLVRTELSPTPSQSKIVNLSNWQY